MVTAFVDGLSSKLKYMRNNGEAHLIPRKSNLPLTERYPLIFSYVRAVTRYMKQFALLHASMMCRKRLTIPKKKV